MSSIYVGLLKHFSSGKKLYAGHSKCVFDQTKIEYLGHIIGGSVIAVDPAKIHAIMNWLGPTLCKMYLTVSQVSQVL